LLAVERPAVNAGKGSGLGGGVFSANDVQTRNVLPDVHFALPAPQLRPLITTYYGVSTPVALEDHLHPEWGSIRFTITGE
jgi:hypothetical protein